MSNEYPFIVHGCVGMPAFPTHTHGLTEIGMPEFIMDPLAFGAKGNTSHINASYKFLSKPKNAHRLKAILNGKIIKLTDRDLIPGCNAHESYTYCYREVAPDFEAVKQAYIIPGGGLKPGMRFIQIWVEGDDFALTDEYYRGGVRW